MKLLQNKFVLDGEALKKYRYPRISLKILLMFVSVLAVFLAVTSHYYFRMQAEEAYLDHLRARIGSVKPLMRNGIRFKHRTASESKGYLDEMLWIKYDYQQDGEGVFKENAVPPGPIWLRRRVGENIFARVQTLALSTADQNDIGSDEYSWFTTYRKIEADVFDDIEALTQLKKLTVRVENVPNLSPLKRLKSLEELDLRTGDSFPVNLAELSNLSSLKYAKIEGPTILTGTPRIGSSKLCVLEIKKNHSLADLTSIGFAENLVELKITGCNGIRSLKGIEKFKTLEKLSLDNCPLIESLEGIKNATRLRDLKLFNVPNIKSVSREQLPLGVEPIKFDH